jgi:hypothetical protein
MSILSNELHNLFTTRLHCNNPLEKARQQRLRCVSFLNIGRPTRTVNPIVREEVNVLARQDVDLQFVF